MDIGDYSHVSRMKERTDKAYDRLGDIVSGATGVRGEKNLYGGVDLADNSQCFLCLLNWL